MTLEKVHVSKDIVLEVIRVFLKFRLGLMN